MSHGTMPPGAAQERQRGFPLRAMVAWAVILACVWFYARGYRRPAPQRPAASGPSEAVSIQLTLQARYALGAKALLAATSQVPPARQQQLLLSRIEHSVSTPLDRLRTVPVVAELAGKDAALRELEELRGSLPDPQLKEDAQVLRAIYTEGPSAVPAGEKASLIARHGWFARLALSWSLPASNPQRRAVIGSAVRTAAATVTLVLAAMAGVVLGLVLLIVAIVLAVSGSLRRGFVYVPGARFAFLESFAIFLALLAGLALLLGYGLKVRGLSYSWLALVVAAVALSWPILHAGRAITRQAAGWHRGRGIAREIAAGIIGYITGLPLIAGGILLAVWLSNWAGVQPVHPIIYAVGRGPKVAMQIYLLACVLAPLVEETMFRGAFYHYMRGRWGWLWSALVVSLIFAAIHPQGWTTVPALGAIGFVLAGIREWRGSLIGPITAHALNNFAVTTFLVIALG